MSIPPIQPSSSGWQPPPDPIVDRFNALWNQWFNHPTEKSAQALLDYMKQNYSHFAELADNKPLPRPLVPFELSFTAAITDLQDWITAGCNPKTTSMPSEFIADLARWINYAG